MTGDVVVQSLWFIGAFVLVLSSLIARRLPIREGMKMALIWVAIFAVMFAVVSLITGSQ